MSGAAQRLPSVTVIMPVRNEGKYLRRAVEAVLAQDFPPEQMDVVVVDGCSDDGSREDLERLISERSAAPSVICVDNPAMTTPFALNIGLAHARGDVIVRVDGHCEIEPD